MENNHTNYEKSVTGVVIRDLAVFLLWIDGIVTIIF